MQVHFVYKNVKKPNLLSGFDSWSPPRLSSPLALSTGAHDPEASGSGLVGVLDWWCLGLVGVLDWWCLGLVGVLD